MARPCVCALVCRNTCRVISSPVFLGLAFVFAGCVDLRWCQRKIHSLSVPKAITQLPVQLHKFIWKLLAPSQLNIEITSPSLKLQQHVPEQRCNTSYSYSIVSATPTTELIIGVFCPGGAIEKIQMRNNITIALKTFGKGFLNESSRQDLKMSFVPHIKGKEVLCAASWCRGGLSACCLETETRVCCFTAEPWSHGLGWPFPESVRWLFLGGGRVFVLQPVGNAAHISVLLTAAEGLVCRLRCWCWGAAGWVNLLLRAADGALLWAREPDPFHADRGSLGLSFPSAVLSLPCR